MASIFRPRKLVKLMGRPNKEQPLGGSERSKRYRAKKLAQKLEHLAVLDFETDPFDNTKPDEKIYPFAACLYSDNFAPIIIWENDIEQFILKLLAVLEGLEESYVIYAHNGGKFDYMFLMKLLRGQVAFKGRGIMAGTIGRHEIRDSHHLIPEKLASYRKDDFNYKWLLKKNREKRKQQIITYMTNDCRYLHDIVKSFLQEFGFKISIGQAAMSKIKEHYVVKTIGENTDAELRKYFFGGRVECIKGRGHFLSADGKSPYKMYDVNSMYLSVMANLKHPFSNSYSWRVKGGIKPNTVFLDLTCSNNGAFVKRDQNGQTTAGVKHGRFLTTVFEFRAAVELKLIDHIKIHQYIDNAELSDFSLFALPLYAKRQIVKEKLDKWHEQFDEKELVENREYLELKKEGIFLKLLGNNGYGKYAQNPRRFKESFITDHGALPPKGFEAGILPVYQSPDYDIWERPSARHIYNNVGTAASITGGARAKLLRAKHNAIDPIYCDTDSLICRELNDDIHPTNLGAWKFEKQFDEVIIAGKKLYAVKQYAKNGKPEIVKVKSKGAPDGALKWNDMLEILNGKSKTVTASGPTLTKTGKQYYMTRAIRATAPILENKPVKKQPDLVLGKQHGISPQNI